MEASIRAKLETLSERYEELGDMLCDPEITGNKTEFLKLSREHAEIKPVVDAWTQFQDLHTALEEARELLDDPDMKELAQDDIGRLQGEEADLEVSLQKLLLPKDPNDSKNVILEIRGGTGGEEAALFAGDLWRMYSRFAERRGWKLTPMSMNEADAGGLKEVTGLLEGKDVYAMLKFESGVHRVQRVPATESQGRIHTSAATVAIMPEAEEIDFEIRDSDIKFEKMRASGAGGQHVNTTDSKVRLTHIPTGLAVESQQEKSQTKNRDIAMALLRSRLLDREIQKAEKARSAQRKSQVGSGDRSEKIRTYNYPQDRISDHRIKLTRHNLDGFMDGDIEDVIQALRAHDEAERLTDLDRHVDDEDGDDEP